VKFAAERPYADPEKAARKLIEIANSVEAIQDGRIHVEKINEPFCRPAAAPTNTSPGYRWRSIADGWRSIDPALT
jgi:hypothetical protein